MAEALPMCLVCCQGPSHSAPLAPFTPQNDLIFLRARTRKHEIMVAPGEGYVLVVRSLSGCAPAAASLASLTVTQHTPMPSHALTTHTTQYRLYKRFEKWG
jgi:hypothetical protein